METENLPIVMGVDQLLAEAESHYAIGQLDLARSVLFSVLSADSANATANARLGQIALANGDGLSAEMFLSAAVAADPSQIGAANDLSLLYLTSGRASSVIPIMADILKRSPEYADGWNTIANAYTTLHDYQNAISSFKRVLDLRPSYPFAAITLSQLYFDTFQHEKATEVLRAAMLSGDGDAASEWLFRAMFLPSASATSIAQDAVEYCQGLPPAKSVDADTSPARRLNIGYIGPAFRNHVVAWLLEPILNEHDRTNFQVFCYSNSPPGEVMPLCLLGNDLCLRNIRALSDEQALDVIKRDKIDILIDINLHMPNSVITLFSRRAAPIQINYLAYPFTSGLSAMDYRVTDQILDPPASARYGPERLIRMQHSFWLHRPVAGSPEPATKLPCDRNKCVTFGNLNDTVKLNPLVAEAWGQILACVPNSRLLLLAADADTQQPYFAALLAGIDLRRVTLLRRGEYRRYLESYREFDLCLDPFPYGGHTTTLDSLWMGVPVLTLAGDAPYMRGAASILPRVGLDELVTTSREQYIAKAVELASSPARLRSIRHGLRRKMRDSDLCDETGWVREYEGALRQAWIRHCEGLAPVDITCRESDGGE